MLRIWTPYLLPPYPAEISELSPSARKVIQYLDNQENIKFRPLNRSEGTLEEVAINSDFNADNDYLQIENTFFMPCIPENRRSFMSKLHVPADNKVQQYTNNFLPEKSGLSKNDSLDHSLHLHPLPTNQCNEQIHLDESVDIINDTILSTHNGKPLQFLIHPPDPHNGVNLNESTHCFNNTTLSSSQRIKSNIPEFKSNFICTKKKKTKKNIVTPKEKITNYFSLVKKTNLSTGPKSLDNKDFIEKEGSYFLGNLENILERKSFVSSDVGKYKNEIPRGKYGSHQSSELKSYCSQTEVKFGNDSFFNFPRGMIRSVKNLRPPSSKGVMSEGFYGNGYAPSPPDMNLGQHEESMIVACSYDKNISMTFSEKFNQVGNEAFTILNISMENYIEVFGDLTCDNIAEIGITLCYKEGFTLLNKSAKTNCTPNGLLLCAKFLDGNCLMMFYDSDCFKEISLRNFLLQVLRALTRKICYNAQTLILYVLDNVLPEDPRVFYECCILDPMVGAWLLDPDHPPSSLNDFLKAFPEIKVEKNDNWKMHGCNLLLYQSQIMENIYSRLIEEKLWNVFLYLETQIVPILAVMEASEILVNSKKLKKMAKILEERLKTVEKEAETLVGQKFLLSSTSQVRKIIYDDLELDKTINVSIKGTSVKGVKSTSESMLKLLVNVHPLPNLILEYRQLHKLKSAYTDTLLQYAGENKCISSLWDLCSAATGRITSSNPNLQAIPKKSIIIKSPSKGEIEINLRSCFVAKEGKMFVSLDFQHIELRVFAILAKDANLFRLFKKEDDIFYLMTQLRLNKEEITSEERNQTKTLVYALMYGAGVRRMAAILSLSEPETENIKKTFLRLFPALSEFNRRVLNEVRQTKVLASISGRKRLFPKITSQNITERKYSERQAINFVIQGSAADICKGAMLHSELELKKRQLNSKLLLQIHDELLWEVNESEVSAFKDIIRRTMEANGRYWAKNLKIYIPLPVSIQVGKDWGNMSDINEYQ